MAPRRKGKSRETLQIRPYRPRRQTQAPAEANKASTPEAEPAAPSTSASTSQEEEFPVSDATPTIAIEDDQSDSSAANQGGDNENEESNKSNPADETEEHKKNRGSWTPEKQIVLLQKYAEHFPPGAPWGKSTEAWQKIVDAVNAVAPNDTPLRYDACRRAVDRISERYMEEESIQKAAIAALTKRNKHEGEKADKLIQQESKKERKRMKRLIIQRLAGERPVEIASRGVPPPVPGPPPQYIAAPLPPPVFNYIQFDQAYVEEQRQYQRSVLHHLESMNQILQDLSKRLKK
ncbi:hypothetical protein MAM1_0214c08124 [Mucor ambiguus]|uniref:Uncharacterized protein n=1 Tax=Mucor ambiguus TaxID=91626 RepID=A0A0C9MM71_9FUNG|nr:hypothetical protein MAM1_0214c08124 [Mucor ambiguus]